MALAAAVDVMGRVARGDIKLRDPAAYLRVLFDIARAEEGLPSAVVAHVSADAMARALALRDAARDALTANASDP